MVPLCLLWAGYLGELEALFALQSTDGSWHIKVIGTLSRSAAVPVSLFADDACAACGHLVSRWPFVLAPGDRGGSGSL